MRQGSLPARTPGASFKPQHFLAINSAPQPLGFFEIHAENYMSAGGRPHAELRTLRECYALSIHGVGLSIGSAQPLDQDHLDRLKSLCVRYEPESVSEHLAWSSHDGRFLNDLLPLPYTEEMLGAVVSHVDRIQTSLQRQICLENPATYIRFAQSALTEADFMSEVVKRSGCALLLDINNIYVSAINHGTDPLADLMSFPLHQVQEIHLAGHTESRDGGQRLLIDAHGSGTAEPVMALYAKAIAAAGPIPTLIEWDNDIPAWPRLLAEAQAAQRILDECPAKAAPSAAA